MGQCSMPWGLGVVAHVWSHLLLLPTSLGVLSTTHSSTSTVGVLVQMQEGSRSDTYTCMLSHRRGLCVPLRIYNYLASIPMTKGV